MATNVPPSKAQPFLDNQVEEIPKWKIVTDSLNSTDWKVLEHLLHNVVWGCEKWTKFPADVISENLMSAMTNYFNFVVKEKNRKGESFKDENGKRFIKIRRLLVV